MIKSVIYDKISPEVCNNEEASKYYFYQNALGIDDSIDKEYEEYELNQIKMRNSVLNNIIHSDNIQVMPNFDSTIFGVSGIKNTVIIVTEFE